MKKLIMAAMAGTAALTLAACGQDAGDKVDDAYEAESQAVEEQADAMDAAGNEAAADSLENKADAIDDKGEVMDDAVDDGKVSATEAMPKAGDTAAATPAAPAQ